MRETRRVVMFSAANSFFNLFGLSPNPVAYAVRRGGGKAVAVYTPDSDMENLILRFERKIESEDVKDGKLLPTASQTIKKRGGKRVTELKLSYESAQELHAALSKTLKEMHKRRFGKRLLSNLFFALFQMMQSRSQLRTSQ